MVFTSELNFTRLQRKDGQCKQTKQNNAKRKNTKLLNILFLKLLFRRWRVGHDGKYGGGEWASGEYTKKLRNRIWTYLRQAKEFDMFLSGNEKNK